MNPTALAFAGLLAAAGTGSLSAQLPYLKEKGWSSSFVAYEGKLYQYSFTTQGKGEVNVIGRKGTPLTSRLALQIEFVVEEHLSDGRVFYRLAEPEALTSEQQPTMKIENIVIKGKVKGDAAFEAYITEDHGVISLGGKLLDPGTLTNNPLKFAIRVKLPDVYPFDTGGDPAKADGPGNNRDKGKDKADPSGKDDKPVPPSPSDLRKDKDKEKPSRASRDKDEDKDKDKDDKEAKDDSKGGGGSRANKDKGKEDKPAFINANDPKSLAEKMKEDRVQFIWTDGKRHKPATNTILDEEHLKEINGPGITAGELFFSAYQDRKYILTAGADSVITLAPLSQSSTAPLFRGCYLVWTADSAKDPQSQARLKVEVK